MDLIFALGPPGAGKTYIAQTFVAADPATRVRCSKEDSRRLLGIGGDADTNSPADEQRVRAHMLEWVEAGLRAGKTVCCDDTSQHQCDVDALEALAALYGARLIALDYRALPIARCVANDAARAAAGGRHVGAEAIRRVAARCNETRIPSWAIVVSVFEHDGDLAFRFECGDWSP